jgi:MoaA/NifB/PqqE/SkfB family radical SAM enzyme
MPEICPSPLVVQIQPTWSCNLRCASCRYWRQPAAAPRELATQEHRELLNQLAALGATRVWYVDGEPLLRSDLPELVSRASENRLQTALITNGTLLDEPLARALVEAGLSTVMVSLDGPAPVHDRIRGKTGAFEKAARGLRHAVAEKRRGAHLTVGVNFTLSGLNVGGMGPVAEEARDAGVDQLSVRVATVLTEDTLEATSRHLGPPTLPRQHHYFGLEDSLLLLEQDLEALREDLQRTRAVCEQGGMALVEDPLLTDMIANGSIVARSYGGRGCPVVRGFLQVSPDGHVVVCPMLVDYPTGAFPNEDLAAAWGNAAHQRIVDAVADDLLPICPHCCFRLW